MTHAAAPRPTTTCSEIAAGLRRGLAVGAAALVIVFAAAVQSGYLKPATALAYANATAQPRLTGEPRFADFGAATPSPDARHLADWVADSRDNAGAGFVIVDKRGATVYAFDAQARLRASSPALLGAAVGDTTVPGIGSRPIALVRPEERTTPAGRFVGQRGHDTHGESLVWVDYDDAVAMHRVVTTNPAEHRLERLASPTLADHRISYGCINVPVAFYDDYIGPMFALHRAIVYVLPDVESVRQVFGSYDVAAAHGLTPRRPLPGGSRTARKRTPSSGTPAALNG